MLAPAPAQFREATPADQSILDDMNIAASFGAIKPESEYPNTAEFLDEHPDVAAFSKDFGRDGDMGIIAEDDQGHPVGAIWGRLYTRTDEDGPMRDHPFEITMAVREGARNRGIGRLLLESIASMAAAQNKGEISLAVHAKSPARRLYEAAGYEPLRDESGEEARVGGKYVPMVRKLDTKSE